MSAYKNVLFHSCSCSILVGGGGGLGIFFFTTASRPALGPTQPPIQWVPDTLSPRVKRPGRNYRHSPPSSAEFKNAWRFTSRPQQVFVAWCVVKHGDNFTFSIVPF
jgi:hypothetical protein